jgi:hypothetical protein
MMLAACSDHATLVTALVAAGADVSARNNLGISAHMVATEAGNREPAEAGWELALTAVSATGDARRLRTLRWLLGMRLLSSRCDETHHEERG